MQRSLSEASLFDEAAFILLLFQENLQKSRLGGWINTDKNLDPAAAQSHEQMAALALCTGQATY